MFARLRKYPAVTAIVAVVALALAAFQVYRVLRPATPTVSPWAKVWCYDLSTGRIMVGTERDVPPFSTAKPRADGSPAGVRAEVYSCGSCDDESQRFVGWLWMFNADARAAVQAAIDATPNGFREDNPYDLSAARGNPAAILIASPEKPNEWFTEPSATAQTIKAKLAIRCKGTTPKSCQAK
jgi:hypothetical protein